MTKESATPTITLQAIGVVRSPYRTKDDVPKGLGAQHACAAGHTVGLSCWGDNSNGQLGDGTFASRTRPVLALPGL